MLNHRQLIRVTKSFQWAGHFFKQGDVIACNLINKVLDTKFIHALSCDVECFGATIRNVPCFNFVEIKHLDSKTWTDLVLAAKIDHSLLGK